MRRREFLAAAGTTLGAGCMSMIRGGDPRQSGPGAHLEGHLGTDNFTSNFSFEVGEGGNFEGFDFEDADFEFNESAFDAEFEDSFDDGEEKTPIETNERATELLRKGMVAIHETYTTYVGYVGPDATLLQVDSTVANFNHAKIIRLAREAREPLEEATEYATEGQRELVLGLVQVTVFLEEMARVRDTLIDAFDRFSWATERLYAESTTRAQQAARKVDTLATDAESRYETIEEELDREAVQIYQPVGEVYSAKMRRVGKELRAFSNGAGSITSIADGIERFQESMRSFDRDEYRDAARSFGLAASTFNSAQWGLRNFGNADNELGRTSTKLDRARATLAAASEALRDAAQARVEDNRQRFFEKEREAKEIIEANDTVREMSTPNSFVIAG